MVQAAKRAQAWSPISLPGCPIAVVAARVPSVRRDDSTARYASGWGEREEEALEKCALEVIERHYAQFFGTEPIRRCTAASLDADAVAPTDIMLFGESQYEVHESQRHLEDSEDFPTRWSSTAQIDWIAANPVLSSEPAWLPAGLCFLGHENDRALGLLPADSNGLAAGRSASDAAVRAFVELVERDAVAIWWYNRLIRPQIAIADLGDPLVERYADWNIARKRSLRIIDLTHDCGIPVLAAVAHDISGGCIALGFGAGASASDAAQHAIGELAQFEANVSLIEQRVYAEGEEGVTQEALRLLRWWRKARIQHWPHLHAAPTRPPPAASPALDLQACHELCRNLGLRFLALDLTQLKEGPAVVRVLVPGMRPMWPRFAPGRLFDVPVRLGWLPRPLALHELNPTPIMF